MAQNLLEKQRVLESAPDQFLDMLLGAGPRPPSPSESVQYPQYLAFAEKMRRNEFRQAYAADQSEQQMTGRTVLEDMLSGLGGGDPQNLAGAEMMSRSQGGAPVPYGGQGVTSGAPGGPVPPQAMRGPVPPQATRGPVQGQAQGPPQMMARGGLVSGGNGMSTGVSDDIPAFIQGSPPEPVRLSEGEFVVPADVVSGLGDGSSESGARRLRGLMENIRGSGGRSPMPIRSFYGGGLVKGYAAGDSVEKGLTWEQIDELEAQIDALVEAGEMSLAEGNDAKDRIRSQRQRPEGEVMEVGRGPQVPELEGIQALFPSLSGDLGGDLARFQGMVEPGPRFSERPLDLYTSQSPKPEGIETMRVTREPDLPRRGIPGRRNIPAGPEFMPRSNFNQVGYGVAPPSDPAAGIISQLQTMTMDPSRLVSEEVMPQLPMQTPVPPDMLVSEGMMSQGAGSDVPVNGLLSTLESMGRSGLSEFGDLATRGPGGYFYDRMLPAYGDYAEHLLRGGVDVGAGMAEILGSAAAYPVYGTEGVSEWRPYVRDALEPYGGGALRPYLRPDLPPRSAEEHSVLRRVLESAPGFGLPLSDFEFGDIFESVSGDREAPAVGAPSQEAEEDVVSKVKPKVVTEEKPKVVTEGKPDRVMALSEKLARAEAQVVELANEAAERSNLPRPEVDRAEGRRRYMEPPEPYSITKDAPALLAAAGSILNPRRGEQVGGIGAGIGRGLTTVGEIALARGAESRKDERSKEEREYDWEQRAAIEDLRSARALEGDVARAGATLRAAHLRRLFSEENAAKQHGWDVAKAVSATLDNRLSKFSQDNRDMLVRLEAGDITMEYYQRWFDTEFGMYARKREGSAGGGLSSVNSPKEALRKG